MRIQMVLYAYGFYSGELDGIAGPNTRNAIAKFQKSWGLSITGAIDEKLIILLGVSVE